MKQSMYKNKIKTMKYKNNKRVYLKSLSDYEICIVGENIINNYSIDDLRYIRTTICKNSYIEIMSEDGEEILEELKEKFNF